MGRRYWLVLFFGCVAIVLTITGGTIFGIERHKENYFVENQCLVVDAVLVSELCSDAICYVPIWTVLYNDTLIITDNSQNRVRIIGSKSTTYRAAFRDLDKYLVSTTNCHFYHCYT